jgi:hypothetical protein
MLCNHKGHKNLQAGKIIPQNRKIFLALAVSIFFLLNITSVFALTYETVQDVYGILGDGTERTGAYNITFKVRSCDDSVCSGESWSSLYTNATYNDISSLNNNQYFQYIAFFYTEDQNYTPMLFNSTVGYTKKIYPTNVTLNIGNDSDTEWNQTGIFDYSVAIDDTNTTPTFTSELNDVLAGECSCSGCELNTTDRTCKIPFVLSSDTQGKINVSNINISYDLMSLNITTIDQNLNTIENAYVEIFTPTGNSTAWKTAYTDSSGKASFTTITGKTYDIKLSKTGYISNTDNTNVDPNGTYTLSMVALIDYIKVYLYDQNNTPLSGKTVNIYLANNATVYQTNTTDADGYTEFFVDVQNYDLKIDPTGWNRFYEDILPPSTKKLYGLLVNVTDQNAQAINNALVWVYEAGTTTSHNGNTNSSGMITFGLENQSYDISTFKQGVFSRLLRQNVPSTANVELDLTITDYLDEINRTVHAINDSITNTIIPYLQEINSTTHTTYSYLTDTIKPQLDGIGTNVSYIRDNMATATALSTMQTDVTWLVDNVATQENITMLEGKINTIDSNVDTLITRTDCSTPANSVLCTYLDNTNSTVTDIKNNWGSYTADDIITRLNEVNTTTQNTYSYLQNEITTRLTELNTTTQNIYTDTQNLLTKWGTYTAEQLYNISNATYIRTGEIYSDMAKASALSNMQTNITWLINNVATQTNITLINSKLDTINSTVSSIKTQTDCSNPANSELCTYLNSINTTVNTIYSEMATQENISAILSDTNWLVSNVATQENITETFSRLTTINDTINSISSDLTSINSSLQTKIDNIQNNITWLINNVALQSNISTILSDTNWLVSNVATQTNMTETFSRLTTINNTVNSISSDLTSINSSLQTKIDNVQNDVTWVRNNVATQENMTGVITRLTEINSTTNEIDTYLDGEITTRLTEINFTTNEIDDYLDNDITNRLTEINTTTQNNYDYLQNTVYTKLNLTWNNTQQTLTYIGNPADDENNNTLFGEHQYTQNRVGEINSNLTYLITLTEHINITTEAINSTVSTILLEVDDLEELHQCSINPNSTICTLLNNIKTDTGDILTLTTAINTTISCLNLFSISALIAGSPRYANEEALIEATFTTQNGSYITPDTINITIYDPNDNIWQTATKPQFTEGSDHIWTYSKSISATPTTGMYTVHMVSSYQGVSASRSAQFRIATGGPYKVYLECPDSGYVGQNLVCSVILKDEGEVPTESTSTVWVDLDNNGVWNAGETQVSFSKETVPLQNVTQSVSLNVPSTYPTGLQVIRVDTSYASSSQPNSGASDSVTFSTAPAEDGGDTGAGSGAGTGGSGGVPTLEVEEKEGKIQIIDNFPEKIEIIKTESLEKTIEVKNIGEGNLNNVGLIVSGLPLDSFTITPEKYNIILPEETKTFTITFNADIEAKEYEIKFIVTSDEGSKEVNSVLVVNGIEEVIPKVISEEEEKEKAPITMPSYLPYILIGLIVLAGLVYFTVKKKEAIKGLFKKKQEPEKKATKKEYTILNAKNILIAVLGLVVLGLILLSLSGISIKELPAKIINAMSIPSFAFKEVYVTWIILTAVLVVLILILKELKRIAPKKKTKKKKYKKRTKK